AIAVELARAGFDLVLHHGRSSADEATAACRAAGAEVATIAADLADPAGCDRVIAAVFAGGPTLHLLVNNASVFPARPFADITAAEWDEVQAVNVRAPFLLCRGLLPALQQADPALLGAPAGTGGVVVHLCDIGAERPLSGHAHYSASKAALVMLVRAMAVELAPAVRTVGISPGQVAWPESYDEALRERLTRRIPLARAGTPEDVARLVRFVALEGHYLNGAVVPLDGGLASRY
ncbi:MAG: SDR family oxidoreductase, partial [Deltaproteobacteria bacterium]|nr:SDR family oxidoreductase [Deltaproteobacteria bacterium]